MQILQDHMEFEVLFNSAMHGSMEDTEDLDSEGDVESGNEVDSDTDEEQGLDFVDVSGSGDRSEDDDDQLDEEELVEEASGEEEE